jgi:hypothetical protein
VKSLYNAVTGRTIQAKENTFWDEYVASVKRRNAVVHAGTQFNSAAADASRKACEAFLNYVGM